MRIFDFSNHKNLSKNHNKPTIVILSDLWGKGNNEWIDIYIDLLDAHYNISFFDCCELGELNMNGFSQENIHQQFLNGGIDTAVINLNKKIETADTILGFSIGGTIAWRACLLGLKTKNLISISSTRLRLEVEKPNSNIQLFFGEKDENTPPKNWFERMDIKPNIIPDKAHEMYRDKDVSKFVCQSIIRNK